MKPLVYVLLLCLAEIAHAGCGPEQLSAAQMRQHGVIISQPLGVSDVERKNLVEVYVNGVKKRLPFGYINDKWLEFLRQRREGDKIVFFEAALENSGFFSKGYALLRHGCVVVATAIYTVES
jgi:hypothetical protein